LFLSTSETFISVDVNFIEALIKYLQGLSLNCRRWQEKGVWDVVHVVNNVRNTL